MVARMKAIRLYLVIFSMIISCSKKEDFTTPERLQIYTGWFCKALQDYNGVQIPRMTANSVVEKCVETNSGKVIYEDQSINCLSWVVNETFLDLTQLNDSSIDSICVTAQGDEVNLDHELGSGSFNNQALSCEEYEYVLSSSICGSRMNVQFYRISGTEPSTSCIPEGKNTCVDFLYSPSASELDSICQNGTILSEHTCKGRYGDGAYHSMYLYDW